MAMIRKLVQAEINALGDDEVEVIVSTSALARDGHILLPQGCVVENYRCNPIWLWSHDTDVPTGNAEDIMIDQNSIRCRVRFAPRGISPRADEVNGLVKAGVVRAVSIGFEPIEMEPLDPKKPRGGQRITKWDWLEASWVSVPSDTKALVTARANGDIDMAETQTGTFDGTQEIPSGQAARAASTKRGLRKFRGRATKFTFQRGLYQVAQLCYMLDELGWQVDLAKYEAAIEGDGSQVPAMLASVLHDLGDALVAMTAEEIGELVADSAADDDDADEGDILLIEADRQHIHEATAPGVRAFRRGIVHAKLRAGKTLSAETVRCLREAMDLHGEAMDMHRSALRKQKDGLAAVSDMLDRSGVSDPDDETSQTTQTSDGTGVDEGSQGQRSDDADYRKRQVEALALAAIQ